MSFFDDVANAATGGIYGGATGKSSVEGTLGALLGGNPKASQDIQNLGGSFWDETQREYNSAWNTGLGQFVNRTTGIKDINDDLTDIYHGWGKYENQGGGWLDKIWAGGTAALNDNPYTETHIKKPLKWITSGGGSLDASGTSTVDDLITNIGGGYGGAGWGAALGALTSWVNDDTADTAGRRTLSGTASGLLSSSSGSGGASASAADTGTSVAGDAASYGVGSDAAAYGIDSGVDAYGPAGADAVGYSSGLDAYGYAGADAVNNSVAPAASAAGMTAVDASNGGSGMYDSGLDMYGYGGADAVGYSNGLDAYGPAGADAVGYPEGLDMYGPGGADASNGPSGLQRAWQGTKNLMPSAKGTLNLARTGLGAYNNYQQRKAIQNEVDMRNRAIRDIQAMQSNPSMIYRNDPGLVAMRNRRLADLGAAYRAKYGGTAGGAFAKSMQRAGAEFDQQALQQAIQNRYQGLGATQPAQSYNIALGGTNRGGLGQAAMGGVNDATYSTRANNGNDFSSIISMLLS